MAYPTSQTIKDLFATETPQVFRGTFTFTDSTTLVVDQSKVIMGSMVLDRSCVSGSSLELGSCIASEFSMTLLNDDNSLDGKNFEGAEIYAEIGVSDGTNTYYIPLGRFIVDGVPKVRDTVSITALDRMVKFDKLATTTLDVTWWGPGKTIQQIINRCCSMCGVALATNISSFPNVGITLGTLGEVFTSGIESTTYRQLLSYCVGAMGKCAWINPEGLLEIGFAEPLDFGTTAIAGIAIVGVAIVGDNSGYGVVQQTLDESNRYSSEYEDYTIAITGVFCTKTEEQSGERYEHQYIIGSDDYAFDLSENPIVAWNPSTFLANLTGVIGITYSPITAVTVPYPWLMPLDWVSYKKNDTNFYSIVTNYTFTMNGNNGIKSVGESPQEKSLASVGSVSKLVKQMVNYTNDVAKTTLEEAEENATALITSATGGQVYFKKVNGVIEEIDIMDDDCYADFTSSNPQYNVGKCWRWNKNGFGYSDTGFNGTYGIAMTMNGQIVADYISTGSLSADRISGGEITSSKMNVTSTSASTAWVNINYISGSNTYSVKVTPAGVRIEYNGVLRTYLSNDAIALYDSNGYPTFDAQNETGDVLVKSLTTNGGTLDDFVVSSGTNTLGWYSRAWNSGRLEMWKTISTTVNFASSQYWGGLYYAEIPTQHFGTVFDSIPTIQMTAQVYNGGGWCVLDSGTSSPTYTGKIYAYRPTTVNNVEIRLNFYVCGTVTV